MINKLIHFLILTLFFSLPLINSHLLDVFYLDNIGKYFYINGNYEFSKILFFNIFSSIIIFLFFIKNRFSDKNFIYPKIFFILIYVLIISSIFSPSFFTSILGNTDKGHSILSYINIVGLFIVFINTLQNDETFKNNILKTIIFSSFIVSLIGIKEFLLPTFDYGDLSNRSVSTFGHPNYLSLFLLLTIPIVNNFLTSSKQLIKKYIYGTILFFIIICLFLTKSVWAIFLFFNYLIYLKFENIKNIFNFCSPFLLSKRKDSGLSYEFIFLYSALFITSIFIILKLYPEKLSSFISRFYIWETVLNIIFSDIKILLIGNGTGNLDLIFEGFKNPELYIFENYGFVADRTHNIILNIFYNFGIVGLSIFVYLLKKLFTYKIKFTNKELYLEIIVLFLLFNIFNFSSIASYLIIIFILSLIHIKKDIKSVIITKNTSLIALILISTSLFSIYFYSTYFTEEHKIYNDSSYKTNNYFLKKINYENPEKNIFINYSNDSNKLCTELIDNSSSAENYIYCGNLLYYLDKETSLKYYNSGLKKLPDLWNKDSKYFDNIFINKENLLHRFFSEKYGNLDIVLERVGIKK